VSVTIREDETEDVNIVSGNGTVTIHVPANLSATLDLETAYTNNHGQRTKIVSDMPLSITETNDWDASRGTPRRYVRVNQQIGGGGRRIKVRTVNGDIVIRRR
jgi:hypothetical protein